MTHISRSEIIAGIAVMVTVLVVTFDVVELVLGERVNLVKEFENRITVLEEWRKRGCVAVPANVQGERLNGTRLSSSGGDPPG